MGALDEKNRQNLVLRVASAAVLFPLAVWITYLGGLPFAVLAGGASAVAAFELMVMFGTVGAAEVFGIAVAGAIPFVAAWEPSGNLLPGWSGLALGGATILLFVLSLFRRSPLEEVPRAMAIVTLSWLYCGVLLASVVGLRLRFDVGWVILAFVVTWGNDTFAYFTGHAFGRHKLLERISPKKTWEGFAGGAVGGVVGALVTRALLLPDELSVGLAVALGLGGVKDSGKIIPGHGGLLDRIDALLFVAPWVYVCAAYLR
jgi:phosphatidate cytidylyltransferase